MTTRAVRVVAVWLVLGAGTLATWWLASRLSSAAVASPVPAVAVDSVPGPLPQQSMFGFEVGEMRRYILGPPEALVEGERFEWSITLAVVTDAVGRPFAAFDLAFEQREFGGPGLNALYGRSLRARVIVNDDGFPGTVRITERMNDVTVETSFTLQIDATYSMTIEWPNDTYTFPIPIPSHRGLDLVAQRGLFLFENGEDLRGNRVRNFLNNIFANPGLLSMAFPSLPIEGAWEREVLTFGPPSAMPRYPDGGVLRDFGNRGVARQRNFSRLRLQVRDLVEVEIGDRTVEAYRLDVRGPFRDAYVDRDGQVLLIEHEPVDMRRPRHIRLLWPSEY